MEGQNTPNSAELRSYIERVENIDGQKKQLGEDRTAVLSEAKSRGFDPKAINRLIRRRKAKPHDLQEADTIDDLYRHATGMDAEPPLFRQIQALAKESTAGEKLLEAFKLLVPEAGEIIISLGGKRLRIWRDKNGAPQSEDYTPPSLPQSTPGTLPPRTPKKDVPDVSPDEAEAMGEAAAKDNEPVISNPFPYGDDRRPRWDLGWRRGSGNDGLGG